MPPEDMSDLTRRTKPDYLKQKMVGFGRRIGVHPGVVAGQLPYKDAMKKIKSTNRHAWTFALQRQAAVPHPLLRKGWAPLQTPCMRRRLRIDLGEVVYHVLNRRNGRRTLFAGKEGLCALPGDPRIRRVLNK